MFILVQFSCFSGIKIQSLKDHGFVYTGFVDLGGINLLKNLKPCSFNKVSVQVSENQWLLHHNL